jgi:hypothetical protein
VLRKIIEIDYSTGHILCALYTYRIDFGAYISPVTLRSYFIRWETSLYEPVLRKLVNESVSTFLSLQRLAEDEAPGGQRPHSHKIRRFFRWTEMEFI